MGGHWAGPWGGKRLADREVRSGSRARWRGGRLHCGLENWQRCDGCRWGWLLLLPGVGMAPGVCESRGRQRGSKAFRQVRNIAVRWAFQP